MIFSTVNSELVAENNHEQIHIYTQTSEGKILARTF